MIRPSDFKAEEGQPIAPLLYRFANFVIRESRIRVMGPARIDRTSIGKKVVYEPPPQLFPGSFAVRLTGSQSLLIGAGLVSGLVPVIAGVRIDGLDADGEPLPEGIPVLTIRPPVSGSRSWVMLQATVNPDGELQTESATAPIELVHRDTIPVRVFADLAGQTHRLVAALEWRGTSVTRVRQIVWYDQEVYAVDGKARFRAAA
jgi:hypothetical protein